MGDPNPDSSGLIAEVSHELRLPLANLKLLVETLLEGALEDPDTARRMLTRARQEVDRLQNLANNLLSLEQALPADDLQSDWVSLEDRARYCADTLKAAADAKSVRLELEIETGFRVYANAEQLDQVLLNLVENAVKFTEAGGLVTIRSGPRTGAFSVSDTGIGIAESEIARIFQRFYRVDRAQFRGSTGLGLSIVKHIADLHGAKINVLSEPGRGSTFQIEFPAPGGSA